MNNLNINHLDFIKFGILEDPNILVGDTESLLCERLKNSGWFLVKNILNSSKILEYKKLIQDAFEVLFDEEVKKGINPKVFDSEWLKNGHRTAFDLFHAQVHPDNFSRIHIGKSLFDVIDNLSVKKLMKDVFKGKPYFTAGGAHSRRVTPTLSAYSHNSNDNEKNVINEQKIILQQPIPYHVDAQYYSRENFGINFWVAMDNCGVDAPSMRFASANIDLMQNYLIDSSRSTISDFRKTQIILNEEHVAIIERDPLSVPFVKSINSLEISIGDLLVFSNWTIHGTHTTRSMTKNRQSIELRFHCNGYRFP